MHFAVLRVLCTLTIRLGSCAWQLRLPARGAGTPHQGSSDLLLLPPFNHQGFIPGWMVEAPDRKSLLTLGLCEQTCNLCPRPQGFIPGWMVEALDHETLRRMIKAYMALPFSGV